MRLNEAYPALMGSDVLVEVLRFKARRGVKGYAANSKEYVRTITVQAGHLPSGRTCTVPCLLCS